MVTRPRRRPPGPHGPGPIGIPAGPSGPNGQPIGPPGPMGPRGPRPWPCPSRPLRPSRAIFIILRRLRGPQWCRLSVVSSNAHSASVSGPRPTGGVVRLSVVFIGSFPLTGAMSVIHPITLTIYRVIPESQPSSVDSRNRPLGRLVPVDSGPCRWGDFVNAPAEWPTRPGSCHEERARAANSSRDRASAARYGRICPDLVGCGRLRPRSKR